MTNKCFGRIRSLFIIAIHLGAATLSMFFLPVLACGQEFQYKLDDIRISIPWADEPRVKEFGPESLKAAAKYL